MASLKAIRNRIISVKNTQKITKAMKMVAAAKLRRAQENVVAIRPYAQKMHKVVTDLAERLAEDVLREAAEKDAEAGEGEGGQQVPLDRLIFGYPGGAPGTSAAGAGGDGAAASEGRIRLVAVTSDRGLAGAFNSSINRRTERFLVEKKGADIEIDILGKKGRDYLRRKKSVKIAHELAGAEAKTAAARAAELTAVLMEGVKNGTIDTIYIIYNEFKSAATQAVRVERLLPLKERAAPPEKESGKDIEPGPKDMVDFVYEPGRKEVLMHLLPLFLETEIHRILLESIASEFGAKMTAMDNASRNAKQMIGRLTLQFNRARQAAITKELMEIVGGAEALKG